MHSILDAAVTPDEETYIAAAMSSEHCVRAAELLHKAFFEFQRIHPEGRCYLLTDPSLRDATKDPELAALLAHEQLEPVPIRWQHPKLTPTHRPLLVPLDLTRNTGSLLLLLSLWMAQCDADPASLRKGQGHRICAWLFSAAPSLEIARALGQIAVQEVPPSTAPYAGRRRTLRFYDPLVWPVLWEMSNDEQRACLLGPVKQWWSPCPSGVVRNATAGESAHAGSRAVRAIYEVSQWRVLLALDAFNPAAIEQGLTADVLARRASVLALLVRFLGQRVHHPEDLKLLAKLAILKPFPFDMHPTVQAVLDGRPAEQRASKALAGLSPQEWQQIHDDLVASGWTESQ